MSTNRSSKWAQDVNPSVPKVSTSKSMFDALPDSAFVRESQLVQCPSRPETPVPLPFSAPSLWRKVKAGTFPKPIKLSTRVTCWKVSEVRAWMADMSAQEYLPVSPRNGKKKKPASPPKKETT